MRDGLEDTVLLVCSDPERSTCIAGRLSDEGFNVVGPAPSGGMALALAAQVRPTFALIAEPPNGRRTSADTARDLMRTWGVASIVLHEALDPCDPPPPEARWTARPSQVTRLGRALAQASSASEAG